MRKFCLPNFFIVGAAKAGTTSLANYLAQHPDIYIPEVKEPKYFSYSDNIFPHNGPGDAAADSKVVGDFDHYCGLFEPGAETLARGEASVDYLVFENVPRRIFDSVPDATIFIILRNPVDRAFSAYMHMVRDGRETLSFEEAINAERDRRHTNWEFFWRYTEIGFYSEQLKRYLQVFGKDHVFVFFYDDFASDPINFCKTFFAILNVDTSFRPDVSEKHNVSGRPQVKVMHTFLNRKNVLKSFLKPFFSRNTRKYVQNKMTGFNLRKEAMKEETRKMLLSLYSDDILELEAILGRGLGHWLNLSD
jgi:hypothetical protein